jgi:hypothetical protein
MTFFQEKFLYYVKIPKGNNWDMRRGSFTKWQVTGLLVGEF